MATVPAHAVRGNSILSSGSLEPAMGRIPWQMQPQISLPRSKSTTAFTTTLTHGRRHARELGQKNCHCRSHCYRVVWQVCIVNMGLHQHTLSAASTTCHCTHATVHMPLYTCHCTHAGHAAGRHTVMCMQNLLSTLLNSICPVLKKINHPAVFNVCEQPCLSSR